MNKKFIEVRNKSTYQPPKENPKAKFMRIMDSLAMITPDRKTIVFISESIENIPSGFRAKETYQIIELINANEFTETFELAEPGKDFELYSKAVLKKKP